MIWHKGIGIDRVGRAIYRGKTVVRFRKSPAFDMMCCLILGPPKNKAELFDAVYGHRADGGPDYGYNIIATFMTQKKGHFEALGLELKKERGAHSWTRYQLVPKEPA